MLLLSHAAESGIKLIYRSRNPSTNSKNMSWYQAMCDTLWTWHDIRPCLIPCEHQIWHFRLHNIRPCMIPRERPIWHKFRQYVIPCEHQIWHDIRPSVMCDALWTLTWHDPKQCVIRCEHQVWQDLMLCVIPYEHQIHLSGLHITDWVVWIRFEDSILSDDILLVNKCLIPLIFRVVMKVITLFSLYYAPPDQLISLCWHDIC